MKMFGFRIYKKFKSSTQFVRYTSHKPEFAKRFTILRVTPPHFDGVIHLFRYSYLNGEPLLMAADLSYKSNPLLENALLKSLAQGKSLMARCNRTGSIVGAAVNRTICPWDTDKAIQFAKQVTCPKMAQIIQFRAHVMKTADCWNKFHEEDICEVAFIMTDQANERHGIATNLLQTSIDVAKDVTYNVIAVIATNFYVQKICRRLGMKLITDIPYKNFTDYDYRGTTMLLPPPPHESVQVYVSLPHAPPTDAKK